MKLLRHNRKKEPRNKNEAHFFRKNRPTEPSKPPKTANANAAVTQAGKLV